MSTERDENPGAALVRKRWEKTTAEERSKIAVQLNEIRWSKPRKRRSKKAKGECHE